MNRPNKLDCSTIQLDRLTTDKHSNLLEVTKKMKYCEYTPRAIFTTLYFIRDLRMIPICKNVCPWQAFQPKFNVTL
jgi:hypothetical protein